MNRCALLISTVLSTLSFVGASALAQDEFETTEYRNQSGLGMIRAAEAYRLGYTGAGVLVGVFDSGISAWHPEFAGQVAGGYDFARRMPVTQSDGFDIDGHGSHVNGIIGAARDGIGMHGVAFNSRLFSVRYNGEAEGEGDELSVLDSEFARSWSYMATRNLTVINNSLGVNDCDEYADGSEPCNVTDYGRTPGATFNVDELFGKTRAALGELQRAGTLMVFATGNEQQLHPDLLAGMPHHYPELEPNWLAVAAVDVDSGALAWYSNRCGVAARWCLAAPGSVEGDVGIVSVSNEGGYVRLSGTSMAAPHVTGAVALVKEAFPFFTATQLQQTILTTATDLTPADGHRYDDVYGWGLLNVGKAVRGPALFVSTFDVDTQGYTATFANDIGDLFDDPKHAGQSGSLIKRGAGTLTLSGTNSYRGTTTVESGALVIAGINNTGDTVVNGGMLHVAKHAQLNSPYNTVNGGRFIANGTLAPTSTTRVNPRGTLGGNGIVGTLINYGTVAPGNSVGTLTVAGDYIAHPGSVLHIEVDPDNSYDRLIVGGNAALDGTLALRGGPFRPGIAYNFLTLTDSTKSLSGNFGEIDSPLLFLTPSLMSGGGTGLAFNVARNQVRLADYGYTANQRAVASAMDAVSSAPPAALSAEYDDVLNATARTLPGLMDALSGEGHASVQSVLTAQGEQWVSAVTQRLNDGFAQEIGREVRPLWVSVQRQWADLGGEDGSADTRGRSYGLYLGADTALPGGWRAGGAIGLHDGRIETDARGTYTDSQSYTAAVYGARQWLVHDSGALTWRVSAAYTHYDLDGRRSLSAGGAQTLKARYDARQLQAFTELGYAFGARHELVLEPFGRFAWSGLRSEGFSESGGSAALQARSREEQTASLTLGLRLHGEMPVASDSNARWKAELGWRHARGDLTPKRHMAFAGAPDIGFTVAGAPLARNALQMGLNAELDVGKDIAVGAQYNGQIGGGNRNHAGSLFLNIRF